MTGLVLYPLICVALFYLGSQALITESLWSRYPDRVDSFMSCPACTGFWLGLGCGALGWWLEIPFLALDSRQFVTPILIGLCAITWTPLLANLHTRAMTYSLERHEQERRRQEQHHRMGLLRLPKKTTFSQ